VDREEVIAILNFIRYEDIYNIKIPVVSYNNNLIILVKTLSKIHAQENLKSEIKTVTRINELIRNNIYKFVNNKDLFDLKNSKSETFPFLRNYNIFSQNSLNSSKNIYALSLNGYIKLLNSLEDGSIGKEVIKKYFSSNIEEYAILESRKEVLFRNSVKNCLKDIYTISFQYSVDGYKIDIYIPELNLAIEFDEQGGRHTYEPMSDIKRQKYVENKLGCKFIRVSETLNLEEGINIILKYILRKTA
jgi:very-short-patch-repair endonuclease